MEILSRTSNADSVENVLRIYVTVLKVANATLVAIVNVTTVFILKIVCFTNGGEMYGLAKTKASALLTSNS